MLSPLREKLLQARTAMTCEDTRGWSIGVRGAASNRGMDEPWSALQMTKRTKSRRLRAGIPLRVTAQSKSMTLPRRSA